MVTQTSDRKNWLTVILRSRLAVYFFGQVILFETIFILLNPS